MPVCFQLSFDIPIQVQSIDGEASSRLPLPQSIDGATHSTGVSRWDDICIGESKLLGFSLPQQQQSLDVCSYRFNLAVICSAEGLVEVRSENLVSSTSINYWSLLVKSLSCTAGAMIRESFQLKSPCKTPPKPCSLENHSKGLLYYRLEGAQILQPQATLSEDLLREQFLRGLKNGTIERALINPLHSNRHESSNQADPFLSVLLAFTLIICILVIIIGCIKIFQICCGRGAADQHQARFICDRRLGEVTRRLVFRDIDNRFNELDCCICMDTYSQDDEVLQIVRCHHFSHHSCLMHWLNRSNSCPICKHSIDIYQLDRPPLQPADQDPLQLNLGVEMMDVDQV